MLNKETAKTLVEWEPISDRLTRARFNSKYSRLTIITIIQCYAPTNEADPQEKDDWYEQLQYTISKVPQHDVLMVIGDMNAKVGSDNTDLTQVMGTHDCGEMNDNGKRLVEFCMQNNCIIGGTIFPHKNIHKLTWKSPGSQTTNQIDHVIINCKWRHSVLDVKVHFGADVSSDHYLLVAKVKLKLQKAYTKGKMRQQLDIAKLRIPKYLLSKYMSKC